MSKDEESFYFVLDYDSMETKFVGLSETSESTFEKSVKNRKNKNKSVHSYWKLYSCGDKSTQWSPKSKNSDSKWSIPILKSNLQKAIRLMDVEHAIRSTLQLAMIDPGALLRRLPIIAIEDVTLIKGTAVIIWLMMQSKNFLYLKEIQFIIKYVITLCYLEQTFHYDHLLSPPELDFNTILDDASATNRAEVAAVYIRYAYGGMRSDLIMLQQSIITFSHNSIEDVMDLVEDYTIPTCIEFKYKLLASAIDYHPCPWILNFIQKKSHLTKDRIKYLIWHGLSAVNKRKEDTINMAEVMKKDKDWKLMYNNLIIMQRLIYKNHKQVY